jgi:DNA-binding NarL/FixJ family response regulator
MQHTILNFRPTNIGPESELVFIKISPIIRKALLEINHCVHTECTSWDSLEQAYIDTNPVFVEFHASLISTCNMSPLEFVEQLRSKVGRTAKLVAIIRYNTDINIVRGLQDAGIAGVSLHGGTWGTEGRTSSVAHIIKVGTYWPEDIICTLPDCTIAKKPVNVYFGSNYTMLPEEMLVTSDWTIKYCPNWKDLTEFLNEQPSYITFHIGTALTAQVSVQEFISMVETLLKLLLPNYPVAIGVVIENSTPLSVVKELKKTSVAGIIPSVASFGLDEAINGLITMTRTKTNWPQHIIEKLPGNKIKLAPRRKQSNDILLTTRQQEIFNLVSRRGLSNKKIAQILSISESTVKVHISAILKAYCVKNRTQLALSGSPGGLRA